MPSKSDYPGQSPSTDGGGDHGIPSLEKGCWIWQLLGEGETVSSGVWSLFQYIVLHPCAYRQHQVDSVVLKRRGTSS